ncbi:MAG: hypothetical protein Q3M30_07980 [Candidatus Electrothrix sp. Rat3]|nr:hypothetical protein [Candidatus Electrothrix rattekaaiensis]
MKELLKNMLYTGVGAAFLTRDKLDEIRKDLVDRGNLTKEEGKEFVEDLLKKSNSARDQLEIWLDRQVEDRIKGFNLATTDEVAELRRKVEELQVALNSKKTPETNSEETEDIEDA